MSLLPKLSLLSISLLGVTYLSICGMLYLRQTRMIFFPLSSVEVTPDALGLDYKEVWLSVRAQNFWGDLLGASPSNSVRQSEQIHGWWIPANGLEDNEPGNNELENNILENYVLLYLHGNGINIGANLNQAARFQQLGLSVLLMDYRGYGRSQGNFPDEQQVYQDAETMWNYLVQERKIPPDRIFVYGHSLGGAIAIELAMRHPQLAGLIVDGSFTSIRDMVAFSPSLRFFPVDWLLHQHFSSIDKVDALQTPVLFIHGTADTRVPAHMSQTLYAAAPEPKQLYLVPEAGHNDVAETAGAEYMQVIQQFMQQSIAAQSEDNPEFRMQDAEFKSSLY